MPGERLGEASLPCLREDYDSNHNKNKADAKNHAKYSIRRKGIRILVVEAVYGPMQVFTVACKQWDDLTVY